MNRPRSRAAWQKEEKHMKKWMALLLCGQLRVIAFATFSVPPVGLKMI